MADTYKTRKAGFKRISKALDKISSADIAYELERDLSAGMSSEQLRQKYQPRLTAKSILIGLTADDESKSVTAIKDLTDRNEGRAMEKKSITHHLQKLTDVELEAMLRTEISDMENAQLSKDSLLQ